MNRPATWPGWPPGRAGSAPVNFNVRFHTACQAARKAVQAPDFGRVLLIHGSYLQEFGALPAPVDWRMNPQLAGRMHAVTEIGSHWMDLAQWISARRITAVSAQFDHFHPTRYAENGVMHAQPGPNPVPPWPWTARTPPSSACGLRTGPWARWCSPSFPRGGATI